MSDHLRKEDIVQHLEQKIDTLHTKVDTLTRKLNSLTSHSTKPEPTDHSVESFILNSPFPIVPACNRRLRQSSAPVFRQVSNLRDTDLERERRHSDHLSVCTHSTDESSSGSGIIHVGMPGPDKQQRNRRDKKAPVEDTSTARRLHMLSIGLSTVLLLTVIYRVWKYS